MPPAVKSKFMGRFEDVLSELSDTLMNEMSRVGRDLIIPTLVTNLTSAFSSERSSGSSSGTPGRSYSPKSTAESGFGSGSGATAAGGEINSGREEKSGGRFEGRGI